MFFSSGACLISVKPVTTENTENKTPPKICKITVLKLSKIICKSGVLLAHLGHQPTPWLCRCGSRGPVLLLFQSSGCWQNHRMLALCNSLRRGSCVDDRSSRGGERAGGVALQNTSSSSASCTAHQPGALDIAIVIHVT